MRLSELLNTSAIVLRLQARSKREAIVELVDTLEAAHGFHSQGEILSEVMKREDMMTTGIGYGVAIPHGKARAATRPAAAFGVAPEGLDFDAVDGAPVHLVVLLVAPRNAAPEHVRVLGNVSRLLKEESVRRALREADSPESFLDALRAAESAFIPQ
uniref:PTS sugar transporter subunit IIA n=1 Tax=Eiseniibacteriota bacterium TaxID=2212470 RepID=A0A832I2Z2_UNCEI